MEHRASTVARADEVARKIAYGDHVHVNSKMLAHRLCAMLRAELVAFGEAEREQERWEMSQAAPRLDHALYRGLQHQPTANASGDHPHGPPDPDWIAPNGTCALCARDVAETAERERVDGALRPLVLSIGDALVLRSREHLSHEAIERTEALVKRFADRLGWRVPVLVVDAGFDVDVVRLSKDIPGSGSPGGHEPKGE